MTSPLILAINISGGGIPKRPVCVADVTAAGISGDAHDHEKHRAPEQALCLIDVEDLEDLAAEGYPVGPGTVGENLTMRGLDCDALELGDRIVFSGGVEAEVTKSRSPCFVLDSIDPTIKKAMVGRSGCYAKVLKAGQLRPGETAALVRTGHENDAKASV